ncbi:MAG: hypothetical protein NVSMB27_27340 [Ktedonobacteraceae bacterium]
MLSLDVRCISNPFPFRFLLISLRNSWVDEETGQIVDIAESARGPTADIKVLEESQLLDRLPVGVGGIGDLAYVALT